MIDREPALDGTDDGNAPVVEELVPASARRQPFTGGETLLEVKDLHTSFNTRSGVVRAVTGVDFSIRRGEILGLVGDRRA